MASASVARVEQALRWEGAALIGETLPVGEDDVEAGFRFATTIEEIRGITWDLWGAELSHEQAIQRILVAGFPIKGGVALKMFAVVEGESGEYQRAWHINVQRFPDGSIHRVVRDGKTFFVARSIDLGFMQFNVDVADQEVEMTKEAVTAWVEDRFASRPELADPWESAALALDLWLRRGFQPWYAYKPGTEPFALKMRYGALAFSNWLVHSYVDPRARVKYA